MMLSFVHLSDIHFGQEKDNAVVVHEDARRELIKDVAGHYADREPATGILVTGDTAYGGTKPEYDQAAIFLDETCAAAKCRPELVQVVPGNHDIDFKEITAGTDAMLEKIVEGGDVALDQMLAAAADRELFYSRFRSYRKFAEGYGCPLDAAGGLASTKSFDLAPNRRLTFLGMNSALVCRRKDKQGGLLLGRRQRVVTKQDGEELVVLAHHPLHWLIDYQDARTYVNQRARVLLTGHEHYPRVELIRVDNKDLLKLEAGATTPPSSEAAFTFVYNILEFELSPDGNRLRVRVFPRSWNNSKKEFAPDYGRFETGQCLEHILDCPNFAVAGPVAPKPASEPEALAVPATDTSSSTPAPTEQQAADPMPDTFPRVRLKFFRDLTEAQRVLVLVRLGALPETLESGLNHSVERNALELLRTQNRLGEVEAAMDEIKPQ